jgi:hypothetical protein
MMIVSRLLPPSELRYLTTEIRPLPTLLVCHPLPLGGLSFPQLQRIEQHLPRLRGHLFRHGDGCRFVCLGGSPPVSKDPISPIAEACVNDCLEQIEETKRE